MQSEKVSGSVWRPAMVETQAPWTDHSASIKKMRTDGDGGVAVAVDPMAMDKPWQGLPGMVEMCTDGVMKVRSRTACFDLKSLDQCRWTENGDRCKEVLLCLEHLRLAMLSVRLAGPVPWKPKVAVAGSAALCLVERLMAQDREGRWRGRWKKRGQGGGNHLVWSPNDVDVFFCGKVGSRKASFRTAVRGICKKLSKQLAQGGLRLIEEKEHEKRYTSRPQPFLIRNVKIEGMETTVSFIQVPDCEDVGELMEGFDMDIARCLCSIEKKELWAPLKVVSQIWKGEAAVVDFVTKQRHPSEKDERIICSTLGRMRKYGRRGYRFQRYCRIMSQEESDKEDRRCHLGAELL